MKTRRSDRLVDMARYLVEHPRQLVSLSFFVDRYESAKSSISEDMTILKRTFRERGTGRLETLPGSQGGARFTPSMRVDDAKVFISEIQGLVNDPTRVLPGGYVYLSDLLGQPEVLRQAGRLIATQYVGQRIDAVMTAATKGISLAQSVASHLNVPFVIVRDDAKVTEGPTVSVNYLTGSSKRVAKMELSRRSLKTGSRVVIVDDFMKAGGTIQGMQALVNEFEGTVVGTSVFAEGRSRQRLLDSYTALLHVDTNLSTQTAIAVTPGNYLDEIYKQRK